MNTKTCISCNFPKSLDDFHNCASTVDGKQVACKDCRKAYRATYAAANREKIAAKEKEYKAKHIAKATKQRREWRKENPELDKATAAKWRDANREHLNAQARIYGRALRERVLSKIDPNLLCVRCGCDRIELLEINHKNGGGAAEFRQKAEETGKTYANQMFMLDIDKGRRAVDDLELLCKPCNGIHYLELKYGKLPYEIKWNVQGTSDC